MEQASNLLPFYVMKVHILTPYAIDKNLGKAYNEAVSLIPDDDWACLMDYDAMLLTPDAGRILHTYANTFPSLTMTCYTNRVHHFSQMQLLGNTVSEDADIKNHITLAIKQQQQLYRVTELNRDMSGVLILISKKQWQEMKFNEDMKCLGVDSEFSGRMRAAGRGIWRMDGLYIFHMYRIGMVGGVKNKSHLL